MMPERSGVEARDAEPVRLGVLGTLVLHSQFILIGLLVLGAVILKALYHP